MLERLAGPAVGAEHSVVERTALLEALGGLSEAEREAVLLVACAGLVLLVRVVGGAPAPRWVYFVPSLVGALVWPPLSVLLQYPQRPARTSSKR